MKVRVSLLVIAANLCALIALAFVYPDLMVSAGALVRGHEQLGKDCFACHAAGRGAEASRCIRCHQVDQIGVRTTTGSAVIPKASRPPFHGELSAPDCMACHTDHRGAQGGANSRLQFDHEMLRSAVRGQCAGCHAAPENAIHAGRRGNCSQCHGLKAWKPAAFDHTKLSEADRTRCHACHTAPPDDLHRKLSGGCGQCHAVSHWKPATFDHNRSWPLDGNHNVSCETCHAGGVYGRYTCYGCHEHSPNAMIAKHAEEGIQDLAGCVRCHRSASGEAGGEGGD